MKAKPRLQSLIFEVTQRCNHACLHCYNVWHGESASASERYPRGELDTLRTLDLLSKALDETDCHQVTLTGGEPLLRQDLPALVGFLARRNVRVTVITNGRLLTQTLAAALIDAGVGLFELPLLSDRREPHDLLSGVPGAWDSVLSAMASIRSHHGQVVAAFVGTRLNAQDVGETIRLAFAFGARAVMFNRFNPGGRGRLWIRELLPSVQQLRDALAVADSASARFNIPVVCSIPIQPCLIDTTAYPHLTFSSCSVGTERAFYTLDPLGNVRPCNHSATHLGSLFEASFTDLVSAERLSGFVDALPAVCAPCQQRLACQGGCKAAAQVCYGSLEAAEPFLAHALCGSPSLVNC